jgi:divalent metal cation (Fe/Co/Zn/Cd) transporter
MSFVKFRSGRRLRSASLVADAWNDTVDIPAATVALIAVGLTIYDVNRFRAAVVRVDKTYARKTGFQYHVDIHVEVDPALTVAASHEIAGRVRRHVRSEVDWVAGVLVHIEPAGS